MKCPLCNQQATTFHRFVFTCGGVKFTESLRGHFKCRNCKTLLRPVKYYRYIWTIIIVGLLSIAAYTIFFRYIIALIEAKIADALFPPFLFLVLYVVTYVYWEKIQFEKVQ